MPNPSSPQAPQKRQPLNPARPIAYALAFVLPPIFVAVLFALSALSEVMIHKAPVAAEAALDASKQPIVKAPEIDPVRPTVAIVLSNAGTEITDFMAPYEILSESGLFNIITVAPNKTLSPTTGGVAVQPDYALTDAPKTDVIVVPAVLDPMNPALIDWVRVRAKSARYVVSLCEGARLVEAAGLFHAKRGTSHFLAIGDLAQDDGSARFFAGPRYLIDGKVISSAGITGSLDATLFLVEKMSSRERAEKTAQKMSLTWHREENPEEDMPGPSDHSSYVLRVVDFLRLFMNAGFDWARTRVGVLLYPGVGETALAASLETFPRTLSAPSYTVSPRRIPIRTKHGMYLVAAYAPNDAPDTALFIVPSSAPDMTGGVAGSKPELPADQPDVHRWLLENNVPVKSYLYDTPGAAFDRTLELLANTQGEAAAGLVAKLIEYPTEKYANPSSVWPWQIWIRPVFIGLIGVFLAWLVDRRVRRRTSPQPAPGGQSPGGAKKPRAKKARRHAGDSPETGQQNV